MEQEDKQDCYRASVQDMRINNKGWQEEGSTYQFPFLLWFNFSLGSVEQESKRGLKAPSKM